MIANTLQQKIGEAMKARDGVRVSTLRMLSSAFNYEKIEKQRDLSEEEELMVVAREAKKRKEAIEVFEKVGASDKAGQEEKELKILQEFLPEQMGEEALSQIIDEVIKDMGLPADATPQALQAGKVIGAVKAKVGTQAEGSEIAKLVREKLDTSH